MALSLTVTARGESPFGMEGPTAGLRLTWQVKDKDRQRRYVRG